MGKIRIYELAKELEKSSKDVVTKAQEMGMDVKNHMGSVSDDEVKKLRGVFGGKANQPEIPQTQAKPANPKPANPKSVQQPEKKEKKIHGKSSLNNPNFVNRNQPKGVQKPQGGQGGQRQQQQNRNQTQSHTNNRGNKPQSTIAQGNQQRSIG